MKHLILGTAGHIDHGKTSLVRALTGIDTDRLPEEKKRGITIELGFAHLELPGGVRFGIVDVPGHERFVRTMVAGVGGMDMVMLVIAADEGVMPQTREHLEICQLLGVKKGLVALTKSDMVDPDWLDLVAEEIRDYLAGSFLEEAPVVPVSSRTGAGIGELKDELARLAGTVAEKKSEGAFRLPVDRVFTVTGFGTVVTGTLLAGEIRVGDEVEILPSGRFARVRGVQTHGKKDEAAGAGQRVAVNLQGVEHTEVVRGDIVVPRDVYRTTRAVDARLDYLPSSPKELRHRATLRLHSATYEVPAQVILLDRDVLAPGESAFVQLRLRHPVLLLPGDPFVLRSYSPQMTVGGGRVLDPMPPRRRRRSDEALALLSALGDHAETDTVRLLVAGSLLSGIPLDEIAVRSGLTAKKAEAALAPLLSAGEVVQMVREPRLFLSAAAFASLKEALLAQVEGYLRDNPLKEGIGKEELKTRLPKRSDARYFTPLLISLEKEAKIMVDRELVKLPGRKGKPTVDQADLQSRIEAALVRGGTEPPTLKELCDSLRCAEKVLVEHLNILARDGRAVRVKGDVFYAPAPVAALKEQLVACLREKKEITPPEFRELTGLSRKFMIPLLEYFDQEKVTIRVGDKRVLRKG
ncbi:MAG: selenocysteine-specific translation elongation factor [Desulfuromonadales bacterium]|nr:MAG: selenocysteine-specific translation elongation factor [Desulfuromonadales bacterium]